MSSVSPGEVSVNTNKRTFAIGEFWWLFCRIFPTNQPNFTSRERPVYTQSGHPYQTHYPKQGDYSMNQSAYMTDNLSVKISTGRTIEELTNFIMELLLQGQCDASIIKNVRIQFGLTEDDTFLALDQVRTGVMRALSRTTNETKKNKDPIGWCSFKSVVDTFPINDTLANELLTKNIWYQWYSEFPKEDSYYEDSIQLRI